MKWEEFENLKNQIEEDLKVTEDNALEKSIRLNDISVKIISVYNKELLVLEKIKLDKEKLFGELYHKYKFKYEFQLDSKTEIETYVNADSEYYKLRLKYSAQQSIVGYLEDIKKNIANIGYQIKNYIDLKKFRDGV